VKAWSASKRRYGVGRLAALVLMLLLWLGTLAAAASPQLHRLLHQDAQSANHHCLITQIQEQPLLAAFTIVTAPLAISAFFGSVSLPELRFVSASDYRLSPSRAPPFAAFFSLA
jgi:hypothetical protein